MQLNVLRFCIELSFLSLNTPEALEYVYEQSKGQPWIVNSLFTWATMRILDEENTETVTITHVKEAWEQMILACETHFKEQSWDERIRWETDEINRVTIVGC
jgi:hypothetical protein